MIELKEVKKSYQGQVILNHTSLTFYTTGFYGLVGESGIGKTTLLNLLGLLDTADEGHIYYDGKELKTEKERVSYLNQNISIFNQEILLVEDLSVIDNLLLFCDDKETVMTWLKYFELDHVSQEKVNQLSQGEKKRVMFIRTILKGANLYLIDEPTSFLDALNCAKVLSVLKKLSAQALVIVVSHDYDAIYPYADFILKMQDQNLVYLKQTDLKQTALAKSYAPKKLPLSKQIKLAWSHFKSSPKKTILGICLMVMIFFGLLMSLSLQQLDLKQIHYDTLVAEESEDIYLPLNEITEDELNTYQQNYESRILQRFVTKDQSFGFKFENTSSILSDDTLPLYYQDIILVSSLSVYDGTQKILIGRAPVMANDVVISQILADIILVKGILLTDGTYFYPESYEELIDKEGISLYNMPVTIVGICNDSLEKYDGLKNVYKATMSQASERLWQDMHRRYLNPNEVSVTSEFLDQLKEEEVTEINLSSQLYLKVSPSSLKYFLHHYTPTTIASSLFSDFSPLAKTLKTIGLIALLVFVLLYICVQFYIFKNSLAKENNQIVLLKEQGISSFTILFIFFLEQLALVLLSFALCLALFTSVITIINEVYSKTVLMSFTIFHFDALQSSLVIIIGILVSFLSLFAFQREIKKKKLARIEV